MKKVTLIPRVSLYVITYEKRNMIKQENCIEYSAVLLNENCNYNR
jgi:hypothetical protein